MGKKEVSLERLHSCDKLLYFNNIYTRMNFFKKITLLVLFSFSISLSFAQVFKGKVLDKETKEGIPLANIYFEELASGTTTDLDGNFTIEHYPNKKIHLQISYVGYQTILEVLDLSNTNDKVFLLQKSHLDLEEVVVSTPSGKLQSENVVSIERKKLRELQQTAPLTLAEAISNIPEVEQNSTGVGIGKPVIRGLSGNRIVSFAQGMYQSNLNRGEEILIPDAKTIDAGAFVILNIDWDALQFQGGLRADRRTINTHEIKKPSEVIPPIHRSYNSVSYSAGAVYKLGQSNFRINLSSGFRAPTTSELLSNGVHEGTNRYEVGDPDLKKENATQLDFSFNYQSEHVSFSINPFFNNIQHYIYLSPTDRTIGNTPVYEYLQSKANLYGTEMGIHFHPHGLRSKDAEDTRQFNLGRALAQGLPSKLLHIPNRFGNCRP